MSRLKLFVAALLTSWFVGGGAVSAMICGGGFSMTESNHTIFEHACYEFYFNNSGAALTSGTVVVFDRTGTGVNNFATTLSSASRSIVDVDGSDGDVTNIGTYITTSTTADDPLVAGVVDDDSCADQSYCRVQVRGPRLTRCNDSSDGVTVDTAVGTTTVAGLCGGAAAGANGILGTSETGGNGADNDLIPIWIRPSTSDG